jgi:hypothetical protein
MPKHYLKTLTLLPLVALLLIAGCATPPAPLPPEPVVIQPKRLPLPPEARQPPVPAICLPTCLEGWQRTVEQWLQKLNDAESPGLPAKP